ncbi:alpha/beta fold hydrolase [Pseudothauera hydrothermalis]|uniref:alpha/beta fold hydrolase n=1 Tax=Pseudothauera hydrothermalis TaxID=2184083 RepID=UPI000E098AD9|nr:alpha/beta fold hydrolase [Pseudothauera hydrothermalis]
MSPPLVLLHGWGLSARVWAPLCAELEASDLAICAPDLPGHGAAPAAGSATLADWSDQVATDLPEGAIVCGWSLGALIALDLAVRHAVKVSRLVLIGSTPRFVACADWPHGLPTPTVANFCRQFTTAPAEILRRFIALQTLGDTRRQGLIRALDHALTAAAPGTAQAAALADGLAVLADTDLRAAVASVRQPTLLIHGEGDALMPLSAGRWLAATLPAARLEALAGCGHAPFLSQPEACAALLERFIHG